jgi:ribose/xylose/arabinose/galactoside ABC-type transport system permease subunit
MNTTVLTVKGKNSPVTFLLSYAFYFVFAAVFIFFSISTNKFFTVSNLATLLLQASPFAVVTTGLAFVIISKDFDLSVGSVAFVSVSIGIILMQKGYPIAIGIISIMITGIIIGFINGIIITRLRVPAFIATLGMLIMGRGFGYNLVANKGGFTIPESLAVFPMLRIGPLYYEVIIMIVIMAIGQVVLSRTAFGKTVFAVGNNEKAASYIGVDIKKIKLILFVLSGFMSSIAGIIYVSQSGYLHAALAQGWEFTAISMAVLGGVSLFGGEGTLIPGALVGVVLVLMIDNGLNIMGVSPYLYPFVKGLIIFIAIFADSFKNFQRR